MKFKTIYNSRVETVGTINDKPSMTYQADKDDCDINNILDKYARFGTLPTVNNNPPVYADVSTTPSSFLEAQEIIRNAQDSFNGLSSDIRREFHDNPFEMIEFLNNPENHNKAIELGIIEQPVTPVTNRIVSEAVLPPSDVSSI